MKGFISSRTEVFDSAKDVRVVIRTSNRILADCHAELVEVEDSRGRFTIDASTQPTMVAIVPSEVVVHKRDGSQLRVDVTWGSLTAVGNQLRIIARSAAIRYVEPLRIAV